MRKLSFLIFNFLMIYSFALHAQQTKVGIMPTSSDEVEKESVIEYFEHTKIGISPLPDGGILARIVEYTDEENGSQVIAKLLPNEITREVNCNCSMLVRFTKKDYLYATNLYYYEDDERSGGYKLSDGKYKIEFLKQETEEVLYTMVVNLMNGKLIVKKEYKSLIYANEFPIKIKKRSTQYIYINFED